MKIERAVDRYNREILSNAETYTISGFTPGSGWTREAGIGSLNEAKKMAVRMLERDSAMRTVLLYASDSYERHVMVGSYDRRLRYKEVDN